MASHTVADRVDGILLRQTLPAVQLRRKTKLGPAQPLACQHLDQLVGYRVQPLAVLHQLQRQLKAFEIFVDIAAVSRHLNETPEILQRLAGQADAALLGQPHGGFGAHGAVKVAVKLDLGKVVGHGSLLI